MHICIVAPGRVPPEHYGGTERVVYWLVTELHRMGHEVTLVAPEGSSHPHADRVRHFALPAGNINADPPDLRSLVPGDAHIAHLHFACTLDLGMPCLKTVHGYPFHYTGRATFAAAEEFDEDTSFLSDAHRTACQRPHNPFVYNGLDPDEYLFRADKEDYLLFLGKVDWNVKGLPLALRVATASGSRLVVAGDFLDPDSGMSELAPHLGRGVEYVGPVAGGRKAALLAGARALLFTSLWPEPFGLVAIEAMVSGTPVLGTTNGALPEVVVHGGTGFLSRSVQQTLRQMEALHTISPHSCRQHVLERFTSRRMAADYEQLYVQVIRSWARRRKAARTGG